MKKYIKILIAFLFIINANLIFCNEKNNYQFSENNMSSIKISFLNNTKIKLMEDSNRLNKIKRINIQKRFLIAILCVGIISASSIFIGLMLLILAVSNSFFDTDLEGNPTIDPKYSQAFMLVKLITGVSLMLIGFVMVVIVLPVLLVLRAASLKNKRISLFTNSSMGKSCIGVKFKF
jgi:hypothetical protein